MTEVVSPNSFEVYLKQEREERERREREDRQRREREEREWMKYEQNRLDSFPSWWLHRYKLDVSVAVRLAKAGFYRLWFGDTQCFSCGLRINLSFWQEGLDPETVHRVESPNCEFITGQSDNVPIERRMKYEQNRLDSFTYKLDVSVAQRLAKAGFYSTYTGDTECFSCGLRKDSSFWQEEHDPETVHSRESPNCEFITGLSDNVPINNNIFSTKILHYVRPSRTNNGETLNNNITTQHVDVKEQISNQSELNSRGSILVTETDVKQNKISQKTEKEAKFRNPRNDVRTESIEESTVAFTFPEPGVGNEKAASSRTSQREHLISATRGSCSSQEINANSVIVSQSSSFTTQTITRQEYVSSIDTSERKSPTVSLLNKLLFVNLTFDLL